MCATPGVPLMHLISSFVRGAVREVFSTMLSLDVICDESVDDQTLPPLEVDGVCGGVSFTGKMTGIVYVNLSHDVAVQCAKRVLGDGELSNSEVNDVVGELTNMVTGNLKSKMADRGFNCTLSIPQVLRGGNMTIDSAAASISLINSFRSEALGDPITVQVFARLEE